MRFRLPISGAPNTNFFAWRFGPQLVAAVFFVGLGLANASAQERPRLIKSGVFTLSQWCGDRGVILQQGGHRDPFEVIWLDLPTKKSLTLLSVAPHDKLGKHLVVGSIDCSSDGRWIIARYLLYEEGDQVRCDKVLPEIVLWDTVESRRHAVGQGHWEFWWASNGPLLIDSRAPACELEPGQRTWFKLPSSAKAVRLASARDVIHRALGPNSGWTRDDQILSLEWLGSDRFVVDLAKRHVLKDDEPREGDAKSSERYQREPTVMVKLLVHLKGGVGIKAEQLNDELEKSAPDTLTPRLPIPQIAEDGTNEILQALLCRRGVGTSGFPDCPSSRIYGEPIKIDVARYCRGLTGGDTEHLCKAAAPPDRASWTRLRHRGRVMLLREYFAIVPPPDPRDKMADLFLIENDAAGYLN